MARFAFVVSVLFVVDIGPAFAYDASWFKVDKWSGEYPNGFTMATDGTVTIRAMLDRDAPKTVTCNLTKGATYHPWNASRRASDHLEFVSFTKIEAYALKGKFTARLVARDTGVSVKVDFKKDDQYLHLFNIGEGSFLIKFRDTNTIFVAEQDLADQSINIGKPASVIALPERRRAAQQLGAQALNTSSYDEWLKLECANGAVGWIFMAEIKNAPGFLEPNITDYGTARDASENIKEQSANTDGETAERWYRPDSRIEIDVYSAVRDSVTVMAYSQNRLGKTWGPYTPVYGSWIGKVIECKEDEKICMGAWTETTGEMWGLGEYAELHNLLLPL